MILPVTQSSSLPPLYASWIETLLDGPIPDETRATCADCAMAHHSEWAKTHGQEYFLPNVKCCSFIPNLPNYLVGLVLDDDDPGLDSGRAVIGRLFQRRVTVTPSGIAPTRANSLLYEHSMPAFGRNRRLICPYYLDENGGRCAIWRYRDAVCSTFFCKHLRGNTSWQFWETLCQMLDAVEGDLAQWCMAKLGVDVAAIRHMLQPVPASPTADCEGSGDALDADQLDNVVPSAEYAVVWGDWLGREEEFYRECARLVSALTMAEVLDICAPRVRLLAKLVRAAYQDLMSEEIPLALRVGPFQIVDVSHDTCRVCAYSRYDPLELPKEVLGVLHYFDGRPYDEVIQAIAAKEAISLDDAMVCRLYDFKILVPSE